MPTSYECQRRYEVYRRRAQADYERALARLARPRQRIQELSTAALSIRATTREKEYYERQLHVLDARVREREEEAADRLAERIASLDRALAACHRRAR